MSSHVLTTPRKRAAAPPSTPPSTSRRRTGNAPSSNPPLAPFPTPPHSRHKLTTNELLHDNYDDDVLRTLKREPSASQPKPLPDHLQTLLALHKGLTMALSLHLASNPPVLPPHSAAATTIKLPNLSNVVSIKGVVERSSGKQFGQQELARLAWLWTWDGESIPAESSSKKESDNPFLVDTPTPTEPPRSVSGLSFLITTTRTLDRNGRRVHTHGIGLELDLQAGETRQLLMGGALGGFGNNGVGGGVRVLGRWSATAEAREAELRRRLERWVDLHGGEACFPTKPAEPTHLPTPSTRGSERSSIPPIPLLPLPRHPAPSASSSSLFSSPLSSEPTPSLPLAKAIPPGLSDPFEIQKPKVTHTGSVQERRQALYDRIKAKSESKRPTLAEAIADPSGVIHHSPPQDQHHTLRQRATLSRLEGVAETVWFLFSTTPSGSSSTSSPRAGRRAIPHAEVTEQVVKSSKTPISLAEAQTSLELLMRLCPFFLSSKRVGRSDWLEMPVTVVAPPSPGPGGGEIALGPASPGRVRRSAGLRDVRERIRRELER